MFLNILNAVCMVIFYIWKLPQSMPDKLYGCVNSYSVIKLYFIFLFCNTYTCM